MTPFSIALVANGKISKSKLLLEKIKAYPYLIAVDGGLNHCHKLGLKPNLIIGDLDSAQKKILSSFEDVLKQVFPVDKDKTDLELAIEHALKLGAKRLTVFAALGGRVDHTLVNIHLLSRYPGKLFFETENELLFVIDKSVELACMPGQTISLLPLNGPATSVTTQGLKWELSEATLDKHFMGISNIALQNKVRIQVAHGNLLCILLSTP